jgi:hypothetical protein
VKNVLAIFSMAIILNGCNGSSGSGSGDKPSVDDGGVDPIQTAVSCENGEHLPEGIAGKWSTEFERNGSTGTRTIEITDECDFNFYEKGDDKIMQEWLPDFIGTATYNFYSVPAQKIYGITDSEFTLEEVHAAAYVVNATTNHEEYTWDIISDGSTMHYVLADDELTLSITLPDSTVLETTYQKVEAIDSDIPLITK